MTTNSNTTSWRVNQLESNYRDLDIKLSEILENHLPHLQEELSSLKTRINVLTAFNVGAIVLGLLLNKFL